MEQVRNKHIISNQVHQTLLLNSKSSRMGHGNLGRVGSWSPGCGPGSASSRAELASDRGKARLGLLITPEVQA